MQQNQDDEVQFSLTPYLTAIKKNTTTADNFYVENDMLNDIHQIIFYVSFYNKKHWQKFDLKDLKLSCTGKVEGVRGHLSSYNVIM